MSKRFKTKHDLRVQGLTSGSEANTISCWSKANGVTPKKLDFSQEITWHLDRKDLKGYLTGTLCKLITVKAVLVHHLTKYSQMKKRLVIILGGLK